MTNLLALVFVAAIALALYLGLAVGRMIGRSMAESRVIDYVIKHRTPSGTRMLDALYPRRRELYFTPKTRRHEATR